MTPVVVDTNVVVSGILTARHEAPVARVLDGMLATAFPYAVSEALLSEYRMVLARPALRRLHGLNLQEIEILVITLAESAIVLAPAAAPKAPDPGDQFLWELLAARADLGLVTGDKRLQGKHAYSQRVMTPQAFIESWRPKARTRET
jgi:putative PIN family toxin of toxin-antitoxin system